MGPLGLIDGLGLGGYHLLHAIRADLLGRLRRTAEAGAEYELAIAHADNEAEREHLRRRQGTLWR